MGLSKKFRRTALENLRVAGTLYALTAVAEDGFTIGSASWSGGVGTFNTRGATEPHELAVSDVVWVTGCADPAWDGAYTVASIPTTTQFTVTMSNPGAAYTANSGTAVQATRVTTAGVGYQSPSVAADDWAPITEEGDYVSTFLPYGSGTASGTLRFYSGSALTGSIGTLAGVAFADSGGEVLWVGALDSPTAYSSGSKPRITAESKIRVRWGRADDAPFS